ncbi:MAG: hypothetical protein NXI31_18910 [bacterium]|nr:hypothetical protein [bacterium]
MLRALPALSFALASAPAFLPAQEATRRAPPESRFTMAAGDHDLAAFVDLLAQIKKCTIKCPDDLQGFTPEHPLTLQRELRLTADEFEDIATTLLYTHGLVIVEPRDSGRRTVIPIEPLAAAEQVHHIATRAPAAVLARPNRIEYLRTRYRPTRDVRIALNMMRPMFMLGSPTQVPKLEIADGSLQISGLTPVVVAALRYLALVDQQPIPPTPGLALPTTLRTATPSGSVSLTELVARTSRALDANILVPDSMPELELEFPAVGTLDAHTWLTHTTALLAEHHLTLITLNAKNRVLQLMPTRAGRATDAELFWRAEILDVDGALDPDGPTRPVMVMIPLQHVTATAVANACRPLLRRSRVTLGTAGDDVGIYAVGMSHQVRPVLQRIRTLDVPQ